MASELDRWMEITLHNFSDNRLTNWLNASKAFNAFQSSATSLNESSYRARAAIINALLIHYLDSNEECKFLNIKKIVYYLIRLDKLVKASSTIGHETESLLNLNRLIKCLLYMRVGDFIVGVSLYGNIPSRVQKQTLLATYSYSLAYEWAHKECANFEIDPLLALCIVELQTLLKRNLADQHVLSNFNGDMIYSFIANFTGTHYSQRRIDDEDSSFIITDQIHPSSLRSDNVEQLLKVAWSLHSNAFFLRRLVWLLYNNPEIEESNYKFLEGITPFLPILPSDFYDVCTPESISVIDLKIFLFRLSRCLKSPLEINSFLPPWMFFQKPNTDQQKFWEIIHAFSNDKRERTNSLDLQDMMVITNYLEQIRNPEIAPCNCDSALLNNLAETEKFIRNMRIFGDNDMQIFCGNLLQRYLAAIKDGMQETDWILLEQSDSQAELHLSENEEGNHSQLFGFENDPEQAGVYQELATNEQEFVSSASISTQTDDFGESETKANDALQVMKIAHNWEEINFHVGRWICHNQALRKIFL